MTSLALALGATAATGGAGTFAFMAQAAPQAGDLAPYVGGGAGVIAVMALAEVTRRLLNGRLIPRETRDAEAEVQAFIVAAGQREDRAMKAVEESNSLVRKTAADLQQSAAKIAEEVATIARKQSEHTDQAVAALTRALEDLRDEMRRDRREGRP